MEEVSLSVVVPFFNEAPHLAATIEALVQALNGSGFDAELVLVDDGSNDSSADVARSALKDRLRLSLVSQPNRGRFHAVRAGLHRARGDYVLVLGARVRLRPDSLSFVRERQFAGDLVWTGHVHIDAATNPVGTFQNVLTEIAWSEYFDCPRHVSFGLTKFDYYPKGSGCFVAPRDLLIEAFEAPPRRYADVRHANDDAPMLRTIAAKTPINISPGFAADYAPRTSARGFIAHSVHRGSVFFDGHGRRESRFFPYVVAFYPLSAAIAIGSLWRPRFLLGAAGVTSALAAAVAGLHRRSRYEALTVAALAPVWAAAFGAGMWRGVGMYATNGLRSRAVSGAGEVEAA